VDIQSKRFRRAATWLVKALVVSLISITPSAFWLPAHAAASTVSVALPNSATTATVGISQIITATASEAGTVTFTYNGANISGCVAVATVSNYAYCNWTPLATAASYAISATLTPTNTADSTSTAVGVTVNVSDGLLTTNEVVAFDAGDTASYSGSGSTWTNVGTGGSTYNAGTGYSAGSGNYSSSQVVAPTFTAGTTNPQSYFSFTSTSKQGWRFNRGVSDDMTLAVYFQVPSCASDSGGSNFYNAAAGQLIGGDVGGEANDFGFVTNNCYLNYGTGGSSDVTVAATSQYTTGAWHYGVVTRTKSSSGTAETVNFYLDGNLTNSTTLTNAEGVSLNGQTYNCVGCDPEDVLYFTGEIAVAQEYSAVLTQAQIAANYKVLNQRYEIQTTTTLAAASTSVANGASDPLTATINNSSATGTVVFYNNGLQISGCGSVTVVSGSASCPWVPSSTGTYTNLTASYSGDSTYAPSNSLPASPVTVSAAAAVPGSIDYALQFNELTGNYAQAADSTFDTTGSTFTAEVWVNPFSTSNAYDTFIGQENGWLLGIQSGILYLAFWNASIGSWGWVNTGIRLENYQWQHLALTRNGSTVKIFKNGVNLYTNLSAGSGSFTSINHFQVGGRPVTSAERFAGMLDQVELWNSDRSSSISTDMNTYPKSETTNPSSSLKGLYDFNEGQGNIAFNRAYGASYGSNLFFTNTPIYQRVDSLSTSGSNTIDTFPRSYLTQYGGFTLPYGVTTISALVVGGGGAGGSNAGSGGSGGGVTANTSQSVGASHFLAIQVGGGGPSQTSVSCNPPTTAFGGGASSITGTGVSLSAAGGSAGVAYPGGTVGAPGGIAPTGGGNGGQGSYGNSPSVAATAGGAGTTSSITGSATTHGGGGGGGGWGTGIYVNGGAGGAGGGGAGSSGTSGTACVNNGTPGTANTGGGGGGGQAAFGLGGDGGNGVVIISYTTTAPTCQATSAIYDSQTVVEFKNTGTCSWTVPSGVTSINIFAVGGGGGGGENVGNGGAGGSVGTLTAQSVSGGGSIAVTVAAGGGGGQTEGTSYTLTPVAGANGGTSTVTGSGFSLSEAGGSGGKSYNGTIFAPPVGANGGGSGGASAASSGLAASAGGNGTSSYSWWGVATGLGQAVNGLYYFAGGGGGGAWTNNSTSLGGYGGGGRGGNGYAFPNAGYNDFNINENALPNTGGGGGGGDGGGTGTFGTIGYGGNGGSGLVLISYTTISGTCTSSSIQTETVDGVTYDYIQYTTPSISGVQLTSCNSAWTPPSGVTNADFLIVAGGGGGEFMGGGGGGGVIYQTNVAVTSPAVVRVGAGGLGSNFYNDNFNRATNGLNSSVLVNGATSLLAVGGGKGADDLSGIYATNGGSAGGEGPTTSTPVTGVGTWGTSGYQGSQGGIGAASAPSYSGGGGGGAGENPCASSSTYLSTGIGCTAVNRASAASATSAGNGGAGLAVSITGTTVCYAGGGGGGVVATGTPLKGTSTCGGGAGASWTSRTSQYSAGSAGTNNLGGGGGAGYAGGSGTVIIRWQDTGSATVTNSYPSSATAGLPALYARYLPQDFNASEDEWTDSSGNGYNAYGVGTGLQIGTTTSNTNGSTQAIPVLNGTTADGLIWPTAVLPSTYTMLSVVRYNSNVQGNVAGRARVLQGWNNNWLTGNWAGCAGVAYHVGWTESYVPASCTSTNYDIAANNWSLNTDQINGSTSSLFRSDGVIRSDTTYTSTARLAVNILALANTEPSNFQIADILVFNSALTNAQILDVENYLTNIYGLQGISLQPGNGTVAPTNALSDWNTGNSTNAAGSSTTISQYDAHPINTVTAFAQYTPPGAPTTRVLTWDPPGNILMSSTDYSGYTIKFAPVGSNNWTTVSGLNLTGVSVRAVITGLSSNTNYQFAITPVLTGLINAPTTTTTSQVLYSSSKNVQTTYSPSTSYPNSSDWTTYIAGTGTSSPANAVGASANYNVMRLGAQNANNSAQVAQFNSKVDLTKGLDFSTRINLNSTVGQGNGFEVALRKADASCQPFNGTYITSTAYASGDGYLGTGSCSAFGIAFNNNGWFGVQINNGGATSNSTWAGMSNPNNNNYVGIRILVDDSQTPTASRGIHVYVSLNVDLSKLPTSELSSYTCGTYCNGLLSTVGGGSWSDDLNGYYLALTEGQSTAAAENFDFWDTKIAAIDSGASGVTSTFTLANSYVALTTGTTTGTITAIDANNNMVTASSASQITFTGQAGSAGSFSNTAVTSTPGIFTTTYTSGTTAATVALVAQIAGVTLGMQPTVTQQAACVTTNSLLVGDGIAADGTTAGQLYQVQTVTSGSSCIVVPPTTATTVDILAVGAGGGGGGDGGNGGGGGGIAYEYGATMPTGGGIVVTVGTAGSGGPWGVSASAGGATSVALNSTTIVTANGGAAGVTWNGGGATINTIPGGTVTTTSTYGGTWTTQAGGGGGQNVTNSAGSGGPGGAGLLTYITDAPIYYGGGGGGGICPNATSIGGQLGGNGGGGDGAFYTYSTGSSRGEQATLYSGGGGGGGSACTPATALTDKYNQRTTGGNGAGGIVVIRYPILATNAIAPTVNSGLAWGQYSTGTYDYQSRDNLYWNGSATTTAGDTGSGAHASVASQINFTSNSLLTGNANANGYVDHWSGWITIPGNPATNSSVSVTFTFNFDDGGFVQVGNKVGLTESVDNATFGLWVNDGAQTYTSSAQSYLAGHSYPIDIWHYQNSGGSQANLSWNLNCSSSPCLIPSSAFSQTRPNDLYIASGTQSVSSVAGAALTYSNAALGGIGSLTYATSSLPTGLSFSSGTFTIASNSAFTTAGVYPIYETVTDSNGDTQSNLINLTIAPAAPSATTSTITLSPATLVVNTSATSTITMQLADAYGNLETAATLAPVMNSIPSNYGSFTTPTYSSNGQYVSTFTVGTWAGGISIAPTESGTVFTNAKTLYAVTCPNPTISGVVNTAGAVGSGYCYIAFNSGSGTWNIPSGVNSASSLIVAGGGAGGSPGGGGGGAGGLIYSALTSFAGLSSETVTVGSGGMWSSAYSGGTWTPANTGGTAVTVYLGPNGGNSVLGTSVAIGGGGGGGAGGGSDAYRKGSAGGSGGGAAGGYATVSATVGAGTAGQGNSGGSAQNSSYWPSGGGGGFSGVGTSPASGTATAGSGGNGAAYSLTGSSTCYSTGGGAGTGYGGAPGSGGNCGAGSPNYGSGLAGGSSSNSQPTAASANTGAGGGGAGWGSGVDVWGGNGGSGVVIVKYISPTSVSTNIDATGDVLNVTTNSTITLSEVDTAYSFTRTLVWQYSTNGTTWNTETATALSVNGSATSNISSTYSFAVRCGMHTAICLTPTVQMLYRARILDTDGNGVSTYSYSPTITVNITALSSTPIALVGTSANYGTPATLYTAGGGGSGAIVFPITAGGTATGCSVDSNKVLHTTSAGTCLITPVQLGDLDYATDTGTITTFAYYIYTQYVNTYQSQPGSHGIGGTIAGQGIGSNQTTGTTVLTVTAMTPTSGAAGMQIVLTGTGFISNSVSQITAISFNSGLDIVPYVVDSPTQITLTLPSGESGVVDQFALQPVNGATVFSPTFTGL
jgi:hypothetical protein